MRDVGFQLTGIFQQVHGEEFLPEIAPVELDIEDGLVEVLQFPQGEFFRQEAEAKGMFLDPFLEPFIAGVEYLPVIESHIGECRDAMPVQFVGQDLQLMVFDIDQRAIGDGDDPGGGVTTRLTESFNLFEIYVVHPCTLAEDTVGCLVQIFMVIDQVAQQAPFILVFFEIRFDQQYLQFIVIETEDDTVDGNADNTIALQFFQNGLDVFLTGSMIYRQRAFIRYDFRSHGKTNLINSFTIHLNLHH